MAFKSNTAEGWANGATVTTGGTGSGDTFAVVSAGASCTITASTGSAYHGSMGYLFTKGGTNAASLVELRDTSGVTAFAAHVYLRMTALPGDDGNQLGIQLRSTADATMGRAQISTAGFIKMYNASGALATGSVVLSTGVWYRLEFQVSALNGAAGVFSMQVYAGDSTTALDSISASSVTTSGTCDRLRFGNMSSTGVQGTFSMDDMEANWGSSTALGPSVSSVADNLGLTDAVTVLYTRGVTVTDTMGLNDTSANEQIGYGFDNSDNIGLTDTTLVAIGRAISVSDNLGLTEVVTPAQGYVVSVADNLGLTDTRTIDDTFNLNETLNISDTTIVARTLPLSVSDNEGLTDNVTALIIITRQVDDNIGLTETMAVARGVVINDNLGLTEVVTPASSTVFTATVNDNLGLTDAALVTFTDGLDDTEGLTDTLAISRGVVVSEILGLSDSVGVQASGTVNVSVNDSLGLTDTVLSTTTSIRQADDNLGLTDTVAPLVNPSITDPMGLTDSVAVARSVTIADLIGMDDSGIAFGDIEGVSDQLNLSDTLAIEAGFVISEVLGLSDTLILTRSVSLTDPLGITETLSYAYGVSVADVLGLTDTLSFSKTVGISDNVGLTDTNVPFQIVPNLFTATVDDTLGLSDEVSVVARHINILPGYFTVTNTKVHVTSSDPIMFYIP